MDGAVRREHGCTVIDRHCHQQPVEWIAMVVGQFSGPVNVLTADRYGGEGPSGELPLNPLAWRVWKLNLASLPLEG